MKFIVYCVGMGFWKRFIIRDFFSIDENLIFINDLIDLKKIDINHDSKVLIWGSQQVFEAQALAKAKEVLSTSPKLRQS